MPCHKGLSIGCAAGETHGLACALKTMEEVKNEDSIFLQLTRVHGGLLGAPTHHYYCDVTVDVLSLHSTRIFYSFYSMIST